MAKRWTITKMPDDQGWCYVQICGTNSYGAVREQLEIPYNCRGQMLLCWSPGEYHLMTEPFPQLKPELLQLQIDKRFNDLGLAIEGGAFEHRAKLFNSSRGEYNCLFVRQDELETLYDLVRPWPGIRNLRLVPLPAAIAGLFGKISSDGIIVLYLGKKSSQVLVVKDGCPLYSQVLTHAGDGVVEEALVAHAIDFARMSVRKLHDIAEFRIVRVGPYRNNLDLGELGISEWQPDLSTVCTSDRDADVLDYPGMFGAVFAASGYDFLPQVYRTSWKIQSLSRTLACCCAVAGAVLLGGWLYLQPQVVALKAEHNRLLADITGDQQSIRAGLPADGVLDNFNRLRQIRNLAASDLRLDGLARMISLALPPQVSVTQLEIRRDGNKQDDGGLAAPPMGDDPAMLDGSAPMTAADNPQTAAEGLQQHPFHLTCTAVSSGSQQQVIGRFEQAITGMNRFFEIEDMNWTYREEDETGHLRFKFKPSAGQGPQ